MYSVVVISSVKHIINSFSSLDMWEETGFTLKAVVPSSKEAFMLGPDVIIAPVKSDGVNGAALSKEIKHKNINVKVILYGRKTYESVKMAIDAKADGYVCVPLDIIEFENLLYDTAQEIDKAKKNLSNAAALDFEELEIGFFSGIPTGETVLENARQKYKEAAFKPDFDRASCSLVKIKVENYSDYMKNKWKYGKESLYTAINNFLRKTNSRLFSVPLNGDNDVFFAAVLQEDECVTKYQIEDIKKAALDIMQIELNIEVLREDKSLYSFIENADKNFLRRIMGSSDEKENSDKAQQDTKYVVIRAKEFIKKEYKNELSLSDVAETVGLSPAYFSRMFKQETGENFIDYLIKVRMEKAKGLLKDTNMSTADVCENVGYKGSKYFGKIFKNYTGYTATEYRTMVNRRRGAYRAAE